MDKDIQRMDVLELIPQRPPFVMIDRLLSCDDTDAVTEFTASGDNPLCEGDTLLRSALIENMAQSCAARLGYLSIMRGEPVKIGFIGDIRGLEIRRDVRVGERITTHIHVVKDYLGLTLAEAAIYSGEELVGQAEVKIALED